MRKRMIAALGLAGAVGTLAAREWWTRQEETQRFYQGRHFWRMIVPAEDVAWVEHHARSFHIPSGKIGIHIDVYAQKQTTAPVVIVVHGLLSYGRLLSPMIRAFYERGYTVVVPDIGGNGFSGGVRGGNEMGDSISTIIDVSLWSRQRFDGPLYMAGISLGGAITYAAAAAGAPVSAISCTNLFTFDDHQVLAQLTGNRLIPLALPLLRLVAVPFGWVRLPVQWLHNIEAIVDQEESATLATAVHDPIPPHYLSLNSMVSMGYTPPAVPLSQNTVPVLVLNQVNDSILDPAVTLASYHQLGGPKQYQELVSKAHWSFRPEFWKQIVNSSDDWFKSQIGRAHV